MQLGLTSTSTFRWSGFPAPVAILMQLALSSAVVGCTSPSSLTRYAALPLLSACVYSVVSGARTQMRPRWASLLGGTSFMFFLQYLDLALVGRWNWRDRGPLSSRPRVENEKPEESTATGAGPVTDTDRDGLWARFRWAWSMMFALRHVNSRYEVRNTPPFNDSDPSWIPSKSAFLARESAIAATCYLLLDLLAQRPPPANAPQLFDAALIPVLRRLSEITLPQLRMRALSILGFAATFWALIRGYASAAGTLTVALGINEPADWRPPFGSLGQAYTVQNFWGKVWHQNLRALLTGPAAWVTFDVLQLPPRSFLARSCNVLISFTLSGVMHSCAGAAAGMPLTQFNVIQFFVTQACGVLIKDTMRLAYLKLNGDSGKRDKVEPPPLITRIIGYLWVAAFMTWSGPVWLYPQASKPVVPGTNNSFLPYSILKAWKSGNIRAG